MFLYRAVGTARMKALMQNMLAATIKAKLPVIGHDILEEVMAIVEGSFRLSSTDDYNLSQRVDCSI